MKKVINGKLYDTGTATFCGSMSYGGGQHDFHHYSEDLYQKRTGEFFLYGEGGPASKYREEISMNEWSGSEDIMPLTEKEAKKWAETYLSGDDYEKLFTVEEEAPENKAQTFNLDGETISSLTALSIRHNMSRSQILCQLVKRAAAEDAANKQKAEENA